MSDGASAEHGGDALAGYPHRAAFPTRWNDNDVYGHVNNSVHYLAMDTVINAWMIEHAGKGAHFAGVPLICLLGGWAVGSTFGVRLLVARGMRWSAGGGYLVAFCAALALVLAARAASTAGLGTSVMPSTPP